MGSLITNVGGKPVTLPLQPFALVPPGERVIYASMTPDAVIAALGGPHVVAALHLEVEYIDPTKAPADLGTCPMLFVSSADLAAASKQVALTPSAEVTDVITVAGQVKDGAGANIAAVADVLLKVVAPTAAEGGIAVTTGTEKVNLSGAGKVQECWLQTNASGAFVVTVTDTQAESCLFSAQVDGGRLATAMLTYT